MPVKRSPSPRQVGFSLVESLVALAITGFITAILLTLVGRATRELHDESTQINQSSQVAFANATLRALLSDISSADSDVVVASDTAIVYRMTIGGGVVCDVAGSQVALAPDQLASGAILATWATAPQQGDSIAILNEGGTRSELDDRWTKHVITGMAHGPHRCAGSALVHASLDLTSVGYAFIVAPPPLPQTVGQPVRLLRPARVALYNSAGEWMMGFADYDGARSRWNTIQPVAGPLDGYVGGAAGLKFTFIDSLATPAPPAGASGIQLQLSATTSIRRSRGGGPFADTIKSTLPLANRR